MYLHVHVKMELTLQHLCESGSPSVNLCLGIGASGPGRLVDARRQPVFTSQQLHELNHQALVFKYIISGLPVPAHLILPIWKSVSCSPYRGVFNQCPSFLGFNQHQHFNQRIAMDPVPMRCRRTDGKRWRCSNNAVDDQKYCERHANRGYDRSRKHVEEASGYILAPRKSAAVTYMKYANIDMVTNGKTVVADQRSSGNNTIYIKDNESRTNGKTVIMDQRSGKNNTIYIEENESGFKCAGSANIRSSSSYDGGKSKIATGSTTLQGANDAKRKVASSESMNEADSESKRCKRTDGKKWRCKNEAVATEKYCARHVHRGAGRKKLPSETVTVAAPPPLRPAVLMLENGPINLNTRLSMSVVETCSNDGSSSSDATTITDENTSFTRVPVKFPSN